jgi:quercetin dioxygenase-like cupin family protein
MAAFSPTNFSTPEFSKSAFSWDQVQKEELTPLLTRQVTHGDFSTLARLEMKATALVGRHRHINEQVTTVVSGSLEFRYDDGSTQRVIGGQMLRVPPNVFHEVVALEDTVAVDFFSPRREDWVRGETGYFFTQR